MAPRSRSLRRADRHLGGPVPGSKILFGLAILPALLAASCGRADSPPAGATLRVMVMDPTFEAWPDLVEAAREFEEENPGVRVRLLPRGGGEYLTKLKIMLAARQPLDVTVIDVTEFSSLLEEGVLLDLQPYLDADPEWDPGAYFAGPLDAFRDGRGHLYGIPSTFTPYVFYYNKEIFDREGIDYPRPGWTWDDLLEIARRCTDRPGRYGIEITEWLQSLAPWIWQNGGEFLDTETGRCALDRPEATGAIRFLLDLFHEERVAVHATFEDQLRRGSFQDGNVALYGPVGYWEVYRFKNIDAFRWDVCPLPRGREAATSIALQSHVGIRYSEHPALACKFIRKLGGEKYQRALARVGNGVPGLQSAAHSDDFLKPDVAPESEHVFLDVLDDARFLPVMANWRDIENVVQRHLQDCLLYRTHDAETTGRRMAEDVDRFLDRVRRERDRPAAPLAYLGVILLVLIAAPPILLRLRRRPLPSRGRRGEERAGYAMIALWGIGFLLFILGPMLASLILSFTTWTPIRPLGAARWAGWDNYARMLADGDFWQSVEVTAIYSALSVPLSLAAALALASLVRRGRVLFRAIFYMPSIVSLVAVGVIWRWILGDVWLEAWEGFWVIPGFVLVSLWNVGVPMLVFLAGLQGIDPVLYEAARLDGCSPWGQFRHVTLPQLSPVILFNLIIGSINAFQTFAQPYVMTQGGPGNKSLFFVLNLYRNAFRFHQMGYASALAWVLFLILLATTLILLWSSRRWVHYEGEAA